MAGIFIVTPQLSATHRRGSEAKIGETPRFFLATGHTSDSRAKVRGQPEPWPDTAAVEV